MNENGKEKKEKYVCDQDGTLRSFRKILRAVLEIRERGRGGKKLWVGRRKEKRKKKPKQQNREEAGISAVPEAVSCQF